MLIDSHCHLDYLLRDGDLEEVLARARTAGVARLITIATTLTGFPEVERLATTHDGVYCTAGVHPHEAAKEGQRDVARLLALARGPRVVGIGETGLDYYYDNSPRAEQRQSFAVHIAAARESGLPLVVHCRDAEEDTLDLLRAGAGAGPLRGVIHCFTGSRAFAEAALELGFYISFSGIVTFPKAEALREVADRVSLERMLIETDAPYLAPVPKRGKRNEPAFVVHTLEALARRRGLSADQLARRTGANTLRLFDKMGEGGGTPCQGAGG